MQFHRNNFSNEELIEIFKKLLLPRMIEEKMLVLLRQGKIAKWFSGIGQEAISVGTALAMHQDEYILPMHRNLGIFTVRGIPLVVIVLLTIAGSEPNRRCHKLCAMIATASFPGWFSSSRKLRPCTGLTPTTSKKFAVTRNP